MDKESHADAIDDGRVFRRCGCRERASSRQLTSRRYWLTRAGRWYFPAQVSGLTELRSRLRV
jgi:hypothetical protein